MILDCECTFRVITKCDYMLISIVLNFDEIMLGLIFFGTCIIKSFLIKIRFNTLNKTLLKFGDFAAFVT